MMTTTSFYRVLRCAAPSILFLACTGGDSVGSSATYTTASATTTATMTATMTESSSTTQGESESDTEGTATDSDTTTTTGTTAVVDPLMVECGEPPGGAVGAKYQHAPAASGGVPGYSWSAQGLAEGLEINKFTGAISGEPAVAGDYTFELMVGDSEGTMAMATCPGVTIADGLKIDLDGLGEPCISGNASLLDYVDGGDGATISCSVPGGTGNGKLPAGITVNPDTCEIEGTIAETRYGTWAWIVRASQSGVDVFVPYCATQDQQAPGAYAIKGTHSGGNQLTPAVGSFEAEELLKFDGDGEPRFEVTTECGNACFYGYVYSVSPSPFGGGACKSDKDGCFGLCPLVDDPNEEDGDKQVSCSLLPEMGLPKEGFVHELWSKGDMPSSKFADRPWILQWSIDYCISTKNTACNTKADILANGSGSNLEFAVIMRPKG